MKLTKTPEFKEWFEKESWKSRSQIETRLKLISAHSHLGDYKNLGERLFELRWKSGRRVYFALIEDGCLVLLGGYKNGQVKDIKKARKLLKRETSSDALGFHGDDNS